MEKIVHRGKWLMSQIEASPYSVGDLAKAIGITASALYKWTYKEDLDYRSMKLVADYIRIDLRDYFEEAKALYGKKSHVDFEEKYYELLERYNKLLEEHTEMQRNIINLPAQNRHKDAENGPSSPQ